MCVRCLSTEKVPKTKQVSSDPRNVQVNSDPVRVKALRQALQNKAKPTQHKLQKASNDADTAKCIECLLIEGAGHTVSAPSRHGSICRKAADTVAS